MSCELRAAGCVLFQGSWGDHWSDHLQLAFFAPSCFIFDFVLCCRNYCPGLSVSIDTWTAIAPAMGYRIWVDGTTYTDWVLGGWIGSPEAVAFRQQLGVGVLQGAAKNKSVTPVVGGWVGGSEAKKGPGSDLFVSIFFMVFLKSPHRETPKNKNVIKNIEKKSVWVSY
jgi:hypothetical protein